MAKLLSRLTHPHQLKSYSQKELNELALDIRKRIIDVLSITGGHLSSNLGIVELTIALHHVFNTPEDHLIFDVGHQSYPHKLLTGRHDFFSKLRQYKGLSGFTHPRESSHDHFFAGHAGNALSLALGVAKNRDLQKKEFYTLPILGDAALTCGLTLEALNNIPKNLKNFIVVLNDNAMSISKNVGAIKHILSRFLNNPTSNQIYQELANIISKVPSCGSHLAEQGLKIKDSLKNLVSTAPFFEQFGLSYVGPIDGHNIKKLIDTFEALKEKQTPTLVHVLTIKGQGMQNAIDNPTPYHGAKPFNRITGKFHPQTEIKPTFPKVFGKHLVKMAEKNPNLVAITPAMPVGSCLDQFMEDYPERCFDVGIAEGHSVAFAGGLGRHGNLNVVSCVYSTFLQRAFDNIFHDVCVQKTPVVFAIDRAGIACGDGVTANGIYDISFLNAMPEMVIAQPRDGQLLKELLESAFSWNRPTAIRYPNLPTDESKAPLHQRTLGKGEVLQEGEDITLIALGHMTQLAFDVSKILKQEGILVTIIDPIFVKPLDTSLLLTYFQKSCMVVTLEEHSLQGGLGSLINNFIVHSHLTHLNVLNFGIPDTFIEHGSHQEILNELGLTKENISKQILKKLSLTPMNLS